jgi:hypothetical protein
MWLRVDLEWTDVSEERIAPIFRVEKSASEKPALEGGCSHLLTMIPRSRIFLPWKRSRYLPPKRRLTQHIHSVTSQKTAFFIVTAVKTSNLTTHTSFIYMMSPIFLGFYYWYFLQSNSKAITVNYWTNLYRRILLLVPFVHVLTNLLLSLIFIIPLE